MQDHTSESNTSTLQYTTSVGNVQFQAWGNISLQIFKVVSEQNFVELYGNRNLLYLSPAEQNHIGQRQVNHPTVLDYRHVAAWNKSYICFSNEKYI